MTMFRQVLSEADPFWTTRFPEPTDQWGDLPIDNPAMLPSALVANGGPLKWFLANRDKVRCREWVLDSGAFSAFTLGKTVDIEEFIDLCHELRATDSQLTDIFALDVIGDWRASMKNYEHMHKRGVDMVPAFHVGDPLEMLDELAAGFRKIAFGGVAVGASVFPDKGKWARMCMERIWPKRVHGLGFGSERLLMSAPFHSVDSTNWIVGPRRFGRWAFLNRGVKLSGVVAGDPTPDLREALRLEQKARLRWAKEMKELEAL